MLFFTKITQVVLEFIDLLRGMWLNPHSYTAPVFHNKCWILDWIAFLGAKG